MSIIFHIVFSILFTIIVYFLFLSNSLPQTNNGQPFLELLPLTYRSVIGSLVAGFILSATLIYPKLQEQFSHFKKRKIKPNESFDCEPIEEKCIIGKIDNNKDHVLIGVSYGNHNKSFKYPRKDIHTNIEEGDTITVHYNPKNPDEAYLDFQALK